MKRVVSYCLLLVSLLSDPSLAATTTLSGNVSIVDGDTLVVQGQTVRLHGVDAAETGQRCISHDKHIVRPGDAAEVRLAELAHSGLTCTGTDYDDYDRLIAKCKSKDGIDISQTLVSEGLAWAFVKYSADYMPQESKAREAGLGIWSMACEEPWTFRAKRWEAATQKAPKGCPIKGNISERGKIYHAPWSRHYTATRINEAKGERWFCTEGEAIRAGWRAPIR